MKYFFVFGFIFFLLSIVLFCFIPFSNAFMEIDSFAYVGYVGNYETYGQFNVPNDNICHNWYSLGYPIFLILVRKVYGNSYYPIICIQVLLALLIIFLIFKIASYFFSKKIAYWSMFLASINLGFLLYPQFILTETLLCFLLMFGLERFCNFLYKQRIASLLFSGFILGLSIVVKSAAIFFIPFLILVYLFDNKSSFFNFVYNSILFILIFCIPVGGYILRNKIVYGYYYLKAVDKVNLYTFYLPQLLEEIDGISHDEAMQKISSLSKVKEFASGDGWEDIKALLIESVKKNPGTAVFVWLKNVTKTIFGLYTNHIKVLLYPEIKNDNCYCSFFSLKGSLWAKIWGYLSFHTDSKFLIGLGIVEVIWNVFRYLLVLIALLFLFLNRKYLIFFLFGGYLGYFAMITGHAGCARFRFLMEPILVVLIALALVVLYNFFLNKDEIIFTK